MRHSCIEESLREYKGQNVLIKDCSWIARRQNVYVSGVITSTPVNGKYDFKIKGKKITLRCDYLADLLAREK